MFGLIRKKNIVNTKDSSTNCAIVEFELYTVAITVAMKTAN